MYDKEDIKRLNEQADIRLFLPELKGSGKHKYTVCPFCGESRRNKGLVTYTPKGATTETSAYCHQCSQGFSSATDAVRHYEGVSFPEAVRIVAERTNFFIEDDWEKEKRLKDLERTSNSSRKPSSKKVMSFVEKQLQASGLTIADVTASVLDKEGNEIQVPTFVRGGYDTKTWEYNLKDDEMLIFYYGLDGQLMRFASRGAAGRPKDYVRVRWSNPDLHRNIKGKEMKYQTPPNASAKLYFPQLIRSYYKNATVLDTLIIQEGEKKAEKACKHGIPSVAIQGIQNIGNKDTGVIQELQYLIQRCAIKKVVLLFDSDYNALSSNLSANDAVDSRPKSFAGAAKKFRTYVESMQNVNVSVDVYFGHIKKNDEDEKGIDDLLCGTLKGKEDALWPDFKHAMLAHNGEGEYVNIHKISTLSDYQIDEFWYLRSPEKFYEYHKERLDAIGRFRLNRITYVINDGVLKVATKYESDNEIWKVEYDAKDKKVISFSNLELLKFIAANGFYRCHTTDCDEDGYRFIHIEDNVIKFSGINEIRNFVWQFVQDNCKDMDVKEYFSGKVEYVLSNAKLSLLQMVEDNFEQFVASTQYIYYDNVCACIGADGITAEENHGIVWNDKIIKRSFVRRPIFKNISYDKFMRKFSVELTEDGRKCEFLRFLINTSNFWHEQGRRTEEEDIMFVNHLVNKITAIGYLLNDFKFASEQKAVVAMDGMMSEIGQSNGRSGKSLIGVALKQMIEQTSVDGRNTKNDDDFLYTEVTPRTRNIWIDDVKVNFDFERFYFAITGDLKVNPKGGTRFTLKQEKSPKFYITTNHAINSATRSSIDRILFMSFSDYYNDGHKPVDDFGHSFFTEWDEEQWLLFDNLMCECNMYYHRSYAESWYRVGQGAIPPPMEDIIQRTLLQQMGSAFHQWAESYFDPSGANLNRRIIRKDMFNAYHNEFPESKYGVTANNFRSKLETYCRFKKYDFNCRKPNKKGIGFHDFIKINIDDIFVGDMDKSGGVEYITVSDRQTSIDGIL